MRLLVFSSISSTQFRGQHQVAWNSFDGREQQIHVLCDSVEQTFELHLEAQSRSGLHLTMLVRALGKAGDCCGHDAIGPASVEYSMFDLDLI
jgi:hypothetical protein